MSAEEPTLDERLRDQLDQPGPPPPVPTTVALRIALGGADPTILRPLPLGPQPVDRSRPFTYRGHETSDGPRNWRECPESVSGHDTTGTADGTCTWCGRQVDARPRRPELGYGYRTELDLEYRRNYDPDWGSDPLDV